MLDKATVTEIKNILFKFLDPQKDKTFIFGSWATGNSRKFSDIDIGVKSHKKISEGVISNIQEEFEESDLPYTVDVVDFFQASDTFRDVAFQKIIKLN